MVQADRHTPHDMDITRRDNQEGNRPCYHSPPRKRSIYHSCRVYRGAEAPANSGHVLLVAELCIPILKRKRHQAAAIPFDVARLPNDPVLQARYSVSIQNKFDALDHLPDET